MRTESSCAAGLLASMTASAPRSLCLGARPCGRARLGQSPTTCLSRPTACQLYYIREIIGRKRKPQEEWLHWNQRSLREARVIVHRNKACGGRWSSFILRVRWQLLGHVARHPGPTREILTWRNLQWWREEQQLPDRVRAKHPHQFNTQLDDERKVAKVAGDDWQEKAQHRERWAGMD